MSVIRPYALFIQCFLFPRCCQSLVVFRGWCAGLFLQADKPIQFLRELINRIEYLKVLRIGTDMAVAGKHEQTDIKLKIGSYSIC